MDEDPPLEHTPWNGSYTEEKLFFYIGDRRMATCGIFDNTDAPYGGIGCTDEVWFAGRRLERLDRLGSKTTANLLPYGEEITSPPTANNGTKFATYWRDEGGFDYADQRYYSPGMGRFLTADPYLASGGVAAPNSWNRYAYVEGDPVNWLDPTGLDRIGYDSITVYGNADSFGGLPVNPELLRWGIYTGTNQPPSKMWAIKAHVEARERCNVPPLPEKDAAVEIQKMIGELRSISFLGETAKFTLFITKFWPGQAWDYKSQYPRDNTQSVTQARIFGNFAFGAVMRAGGYLYYEAQNAAGVAQVIFNRLGIGAPGEGIPVLRYPFGDQVEDAADIKRGYEYEKALEQGTCP